MGYASIAGRARTSSRNPQAHAICDRCGGRFNHVDLRAQTQWQGSALVARNLLVCHRCFDVPNEQLRTITIPPDPVPIRNPRPENFVNAETDFLSTDSGLTFEDSSGDAIVTRK